MTKHFILLLLLLRDVHPIENQLNQLFSGLVREVPAHEARTMAVLPFAVKGPNIDSASGRMIAEYAVVFFSRQEAFRLVDRMDFHRVMEELEFSQTDLADSSKTLVLGRSLAAELLLTGAVSEALGKRMVSARIIITETGEVLSSEAVTVETEALKDFYKDALGERAGASSAVFRSLAIPGWGQFYLHRPVRGGIYLGLAGVSLGFFTWSMVDYIQKYNEVETFCEGGNWIPGESPAERKRRLEKAESEQDKSITRLYIVSGITGGVWIVNLLDAYFAGRKEAKRIRKFYFTFVPFSEQSCFQAKLVMSIH